MVINSNRAVIGYTYIYDVPGVSQLLPRIRSPDYFLANAENVSISTSIRHGILFYFLMRMIPPWFVGA